MQKFEIEKQIEKQPKKENNIINLIFSNPYFVRSTEYKSTIKKYSPEITFGNKEHDKYHYFVIGFFIFIFGLRSFEDSFSMYFFFSLLLFLIVLIIYNKTKPYEEIKISEIGIEINTTQYFWNQIYDYGFRIVPKSKTSDYYLVIYKIDGNKQSFDLYDYSNPEEIIESMNFFRNRFHSNQNHS